jgi:endonuclease/exonuclease/phosphatase family metal-dependent hydrolase
MVSVCSGGIVNKVLLLAFLALSFISTSCQKAPSAKSTPPPPQGNGKGRDGTPPAPASLSVMAYNLENLFDNISDNGETPVANDVLTKKLAQVAKGILQVRDGAGPDILFVEEVENLNVLKMLNEKHLNGQYQTVTLLESNDERGIDVGVLSNLPLEGQPVLHRMPFSDQNPTRGILEVTLKLPDGKLVKAFALHFPSQANPVIQRRDAATFLLDLMNRAEADLVIAGGDFNITNKEETANKIFSGILQNLDITHIKGCKNCQGTYSYKGRWDFLDAILVREKNVMMADTVTIPQAADGQLNTDKTPKRFDKVTGSGISDHLPIYVELSISN